MKQNEAEYYDTEALKPFKCPILSLVIISESSTCEQVSGDLLSQKSAGRNNHVCTPNAEAS